MKDKFAKTQEETQTEKTIPTRRRAQATICPVAPLEQKTFVTMLNGTPTNNLMSINTNANPPVIDHYTGNATIEHGVLKVFIDRYNELTGTLRVSTCKLLDAFTIALTEANHYRGTDNRLHLTVTISIDNYMKLCGVPNTKASKDKIRRKAKEDLDTLYHISIEWRETYMGKQRDFAKMRICEKIGIVRGNIVLTFSEDMARYLTNAYLMQYPLEMLKFDERNPNIYAVARKLALQNSIDKNKRKGTANIISVKSLLAVCPAIPSYEEVMKANRSLDSRIKTPLENALDSISFISWEYSNSKGAPLTEEQLSTMDYKTFIKLYIFFEMLDIPDSTKQSKPKQETV